LKIYLATIEVAAIVSGGRYSVESVFITFPGVSVDMAWVIGRAAADEMVAGAGSESGGWKQGVGFLLQGSRVSVECVSVVEVYVGSAAEHVEGGPRV